MIRDDEAGQSRTLGRCSQYFGFFCNDEYWPVTGWTRHLSGLSEIPVDLEK